MFIRSVWGKLLSGSKVKCLLGLSILQGINNLHKSEECLQTYNISQRVITRYQVEKSAIIYSKLYTKKTMINYVYIVICEFYRALLVVGKKILVLSGLEGSFVFFDLH